LSDVCFGGRQAKKVENPREGVQKDAIIEGFAESDSPAARKSGKRKEKSEERRQDAEKSVIIEGFADRSESDESKGGDA
jgi:hypothetical protein